MTKEEAFEIVGEIVVEMEGRIKEQEDKERGLDLWWDRRARRALRARTDLLKQEALALATVLGSSRAYPLLDGSYVRHDDPRVLADIKARTETIPGATPLEKHRARILGRTVRDVIGGEYGPGDSFKVAHVWADAYGHILAGREVLAAEQERDAFGEPADQLALCATDRPRNDPG